MTETEEARAWGTAQWVGFVGSVLMTCGLVLFVAAIDHTGACDPPPARVVRQGLLWLSVVTVAAPLPCLVIALRSGTSSRWVGAALVTLAPAVLVLLVYSSSDTHEFFCIPF